MSSRKMRAASVALLVFVYLCSAWNEPMYGQTATPAAGIIITVAGTGTAGYSGNGGAANSAQVYAPAGIAVDGAGNIYFADHGNNRVRKITVSTGIISLIAGNGTRGFSGDGGQATSAKLDGPGGVAVDQNGNVYIADGNNSRIRKVTGSTGVITTLAGDGSFRNFGDGGSATIAGLNGPTGVAVDSSGNVYIADYGNHTVRKVTVSTGVIRTVVGSSIAGFSGDGGPATSAKLNYPVNVALDVSGNLYIDDFANNRIRKVTTSTGIITTVAGNGQGGPPSGDGGAATNAVMPNVYGLAVDVVGNIYISNGIWLRKVTASNGIISTIAGNGSVGYSGDGGLAKSAGIGFSQALVGMAVNSAGVLYLSDYSNRIRAIGPVRTAPPINWATPAAITFGTPLSTAQLNASGGGVVGTLSYSPPAGSILPAGSNTLSVTFTPTADAIDYTTSTASVQLAVNKASPSVSWPTPAAISYGTPLGSAQLSATSNVAGSFAYSPSSGTILNAGAQTLSTTLYPSDSTDYNSTSASVSLTVNKASTTAVVSSTPNSSVYGNNVAFVVTVRTGGQTPTGQVTLREGSTTLGAGTLVAAPGTGGTAPVNVPTLSTGSHSITAIYGGDGNYNGSTSAEYVQAVNQATPQITWSSPAAITVGVALSATQLNASANVPGTFVYSPVSGTVLPIGAQTLSVTFTPTDTTNYKVVSASAPITVNAKVTPTITWPIPAAITYGTALSSAQLNATANVPGTFVYSPPMGSVINGGTQMLSTAFTPTDAVEYNTANAAINITVNKATSSVSVATSGSSSIYGNPVTLTATVSSGLTGVVTFYDGGIALGTSPISGTKSVLTISTLSAGAHTITAGWGSDGNYNAATSSAIVQTVVRATPQITWATPAPIVYGAALSSAQLNATANVRGAFDYSPVLGTVLSAGSQTLSVTFTPADSTNYTTATKDVLLSIGDATPTLTISSSKTPSTDGNSVTFTAAISSGLTGTIVFYDGGDTLGSGTISGSTATFTTSLLAAGTHYITAAWLGNANYNPVTSSYVIQVVQGNLLYSYTVPAGGYDGTGNLKGHSDSVMGSWSFRYDTLNRLVLAEGNQAGNPFTDYCWAYDAFGNRTIQAESSAAFATGSPVVSGSTPCQPISGASYAGSWANYDTTANSNRLTNSSQATGGVTYDASGDVTNDSVNQYLYDGEGRICAVSTTSLGVTTMTGYIYGADGLRVAKGSITVWSCDPLVSNFATAKDYVLGPEGEQVTEMIMTADHKLAWSHTNVWAGGKLLATYDATGTGLHFYMDDPLGTRRVQAQANGVSEPTCSSLPYGDEESCSPGPTEHLFTGKERDQESGNDYFGARYYSKAAARFLSPDWSAQVEPVPYARLDDPQSLNLYAYVQNNPMRSADIDGHQGFFGLHTAFDKQVCETDGATGCEPQDQAAQQSTQENSQAQASAQPQESQQKQKAGSMPSGKPLSAYPKGSTYCGDFVCDSSGNKIGIAPGYIQGRRSDQDLGDAFNIAMGIGIGSTIKNLAKDASEAAVESFFRSGAVKNVFGKGTWMNSGQYLRMGFSRKGGELVFRITGKLLGDTKIDLWNGGPL